jgi:uncharacterized membrane protein YvbJ
MNLRNNIKKKKKKKVNKTIRLIIGSILIFIIIFILIVLFVKKEFIFAEYKTLNYPDGCIEKFRNGVAITPLCTRGRVLQIEGIINGPTTT